LLVLENELVDLRDLSGSGELLELRPQVIGSPPHRKVGEHRQCESDGDERGEESPAARRRWDWLIVELHE